MNLPICQSIQSLIAVLETQGFTVSESKMSNYHFNELYFKMAGGRLVPGDIRIGGHFKTQIRKYLFLLLPLVIR